MMQYYTLEQAAELLKVSTDKLRELVKSNKLRAFQDRGTLRFRARDVEELARAWGLGSDAELQAMDPPSSRSGRPGSSGKRRSGLAPGGGTFDVDDEQVPLGKNPSKLDKGSSSKRRSTPSSHSKSPPPKASSDSGVRLVPDGSDMDFKIEVDSDDNIPIGREGKGSSKLGSGSKPLSDSEIQMVPMDGSSDSDVKIQPRSHASKVELGHTQEKTPSDSDIRLEATGSSEIYEPLITEEIDLELEPEAPPQKKEKRSKYKQGSGGSQPALPTTSPFELSEDDFDMGEGINLAPVEETEPPLTEDSSDFHLDIDDSSPLSEDEIKLEGLSDDAPLGGINLSKPDDSGISLEDDAGLEFELSADGEATPPPGSSTDSSGDFDLSLDGDDDDSSAEFELSMDGEDDDSSSEFELSVDGEDSSSEFELTLQEDEEGSSSEFELSLDQDEDSSSEFELTIDDDEESEEEDRDIFETDFEVPALDDESESEAVEVDEDSSEFELDLDEEFIAEEDEDSELIELDEDEEVDDAAETVSRRRRQQLEAMDDDDLDLEIDPGAVFDEEEEEEEEEAGAAPARQVPWGAFPAVMMFPCVILLFVVSLMVFELTQGMWGFHKRSKVTSLVVDPIARQIDDKLPKQ